MKASPAGLPLSCAGSVAPIKAGKRKGPVLTGPFKSSPDADALFRWQIKCVTRLDVERPVPGVHVPDDAIDPIFGWAVRVSQDAFSQRPFAELAAPHLGEGQEETLITGETVDHRRFPVLSDVAAIGGIGHFEPAEIADILAHRQLAIDVEARQRLIAIILRPELLRALGKAAIGFGRPPVAQPAGTVEAAALVVKTVAELVANGGTDPTGRVRDWWTSASAERFTERTTRLGQQYGQYSPLPGLNVNGQLTMGENIGDLGGLEMAYAAYRRHVAQHGEPPVINGLTGDQRFFLAWAQVWRSKEREGLIRQGILTDPHSPDEFRVNGVVRNMDAWYRAFNVQPGDDLYLPPEQRVHIW